MPYKLTLTTEDGAILAQWWITTDPNDDNADTLYPIRRLGAVSLVDEINREIALHLPVPVTVITAEGVQSGTLRGNDVEVTE